MDNEKRNNMNESITYKKLEEQEIVKAKELILEYTKWLDRGFPFQKANEESNKSSEKQEETDKIFILAIANNNIIGSVGLKHLDDKTCEMRKLLVNDKYKGKGIGENLVEKIIEEAKKKNYERIRLNTLDTMDVAVDVYYRNGFYEIESYSPNVEVMYLEKKL
ncbi:MAG: GNAT family N-acetyltransferase [Bacteroidales bacterium]|jgi:N-acetylglutamate synthase-like GNAT family acetyltransferase|nr:GNAT family N-acetyltransferase [Bacteroidales bacterium]